MNSNSQVIWLLKEIGKFSIQNLSIYSWNDRDITAQKESETWTVISAAYNQKLENIIKSKIF